MAEHIYKEFDNELEAVRTGVLNMGGQVEQQLMRALGVLSDDEGAALVDAVVVAETAINQAQISIDQQCMQMIARRQPTAIDLRTILTVIKIVNDLERIGDEAKKIAYKAAAAKESVQLAQMRHFEIGRAAGLARDMLQMSLDAFARSDASAAADVIDRDEEVDVMFAAIMRQLISYMMEDPRTISSALEIVFIAKSVERIGDHAKNIAESVVQVVKGKDVRHASPAEIRAEVTGE